MLYEIVRKNLERIDSDLKEIEGIKRIDFIDVFPTSVEHKMQLDLEMQNISSLILETERGNVYILHEAIHTKF